MAPVRRQPVGKPQPEERGNPLLPLIIVLLLLALVGAAGFGVYVVMHMDKFFPKKVEVVEEDEPVRKPVTNAAPVKVEEVKPVEKPVEPPPPPPPKKKTIDELKEAYAAARTKLAADLAAARTAGGKPLPGFAGVKFGEVYKTSPVRRAELPEGGIAYLVEGPALKNPFLAFSARPLVWVTPKTRRAFRVELSSVVKPNESGEATPEMTNAVTVLTKRLKRDPLFINADEIELAEREYFFPFGRTTLKLAEYGGTRLSLVVENEEILADVKKEWEVLAAGKAKDGVVVSSLGSKKYPNGGMPKGRYMRLKDATPRSFCGVAFGTLPPKGAAIVNPKGGKRGFFLDYRKACCSHFMEFDHGKAELSSISGVVCAVNLYSDGSADGLDDAAYFEQVRKAVERFFKTKPATPPAADAKECQYRLGDLDLTVAHDPRGGVALKAVIGKLEDF